MSRQGDGIYDSDASQDFWYEIKNFLMKEAAYWFSPEQLELYKSSETRWLRNALTILEIMNLFAEPDEYHFGLPVFLEGYGNAITRWREAFFHVWDGDWNGEVGWTTYPYNLHTYRIEHRHIAGVLFERLSDITIFWRDHLSEDHLQPFAFLDSLPVFSTQSQDGFPPVVGPFFDELIEKLTRHIVFTFSEEHTERGLDYTDLDKVSVSVDIIGSLCKIYRTSPNLRMATIQLWMDKLMSLWISIFSDDPENPIDLQTLAEKEGLLYTNVIVAFVRLMTVAQQYPSWRPL